MSGARFASLLCLALLASACGPADTPSSPRATVLPPAAGPATPGPAFSPLVPGTLFTMIADDPEMSGFFADRGALVATATRNGLPPYLSKVLRASPPSGPWRVLFEDDARFDLGAVADGRIAFVEYRQDMPSGGAHDETFVLVDLATGATTKVDHYALSAATFRGGGSGPRGPGPAIALSAEQVAWTRVNELPGGLTEGELRIAPLGAIGSATTVGRSREWIQPISIDDRSLVYIVGGTERDDLRIRDLSSGAERSLSQMVAPTPFSSRTQVVRAGAWIGWIDSPPLPGAPGARPDAPKTAVFHAVNVESGEARERVFGSLYCNQLSGNTSFFSWNCGEGPQTTVKMFDLNTWSERDVLAIAVGAPPLFSVVAVDGGFIWSDAVGGARRMHLFTLAPR